jgi:hypothetical protein
MTCSKTRSISGWPARTHRFAVLLLVVGVATVAAPLQAIATPVLSQAPAAQPKANGQSILPRIRSVSPGYATAGGTAMQVNLHGEGFANGAVARWDGQDRPTRVVNRSLIQMSLTTADLATPRKVPIMVFMPGAGAGVSNGVLFDVRAQTADAEAPTITGLPPITSTAADASDAVVAFPLPQATDNSGTVQVACAPASGSRFPIGATTVICTARDPSGNSSSTQFTVTVNPPPAVPAPAPAVQSLQPATVLAGAAALRLTVTGSGFGTGTVVRWNTQPLITRFVSASLLEADVPASLVAAPGAFRVSVVAGASTTSNALTFTVIADTEAPQITAPAPVTVQATNSSQVVVNYPPPRTADNSGGAVQVTCTPASGSRFSYGATTVTCTARDPSGNTSQATFTVTVELPPDVTPPTITVPQDITVSATSAAGATVRFEPVVTDDRPGMTYTCQPASGTVFPIGVTTVSCTARDAAGNTSSSGTFRVTVNAPAAGPAPSLASLSPAWTVGGQSAISRVIEVNGSGFLPGAVVQWRGLRDLPTTFVSPTRVTATFSATTLTETGTGSISVRNPGSAVSAPLSFTIVAPNPQITSLQPSSVTIGGPAFTLRVSGQNFIPGMTAMFGTTTLQTQFIDHTALELNVPAEAITANKVMVLGVSAGRVAVSGNYGTGILSRTDTVPLITPAVIPTISRLVPSYVLAGSAPTGPGWLTVTGSDFYPGMRVRWNGRDLDTRYAFGTLETGGSVNASDVATPGVARITVFNPTNGRESASSPLAVIGSTEARISAISPAPYPVGRAGTLEVRGESFIPGSQVLWNGSPRPTEFVSTTTLRAQISATDAAPGTGTEALVGVAVPYSQFGSPGTVTARRLLPISGGTNPVPALSQISPSTVRVGSQTATITVRGSGFVSGSVVRWNGQARTTTFVSSTELRATLSNVDLGVAAVGSVTVVTPGPGGGLSAPRILTIQ